MEGRVEERNEWMKDRREEWMNEGREEGWKEPLNCWLQYFHFFVLSVNVHSKTTDANKLAPLLLAVQVIIISWHLCRLAPLLIKWAYSGGMVPGDIAPFFVLEGVRRNPLIRTLLYCLHPIFSNFILIIWRWIRLFQLKRAYYKRARLELPIWCQGGLFG